MPTEKESARRFYAVQRMYVVRGRFELAPSLAFTVNDPYVSHPVLSVGLNYSVSNVLAVGANFLGIRASRVNRPACGVRCALRFRSPST